MQTRAELLEDFVGGGIRNGATGTSCSGSSTEVDIVRQALLTVRLVPVGVQAPWRCACWWCLTSPRRVVPPRLVDGKPRLPQTLLFVVLHLASQIAKGVLGFQGEEYTRRHIPAA
ncbi:Os12g0254000 [Oryza sativa Japonica Group]|uniref:Os12g0254000 protein n=2 Tax=Oryza sativa subsp. japonica TaxID=39947 RepID=Q2QUT3_ORYSJ|nr:hypothetical protein LOC_Os12g15180 [Oryza sativa Japonica Group]EAZ20135.1 hypothetical protein OsJ_35734 [Oryza sativa Japonica Group]BAT16547.1 Os12g0254000 [Oryza sativa Japonica Group]